MCIRKTKKVKERLNTEDIITRFNIPNPPILYCRKCGIELIPKLGKARRPWGVLYDTETGTEIFSISAEYTCPKHGWQQDKTFYTAKGWHW